MDGRRLSGERPSRAVRHAGLDLSILCDRSERLLVALVQRDQNGGLGRPDQATLALVLLRLVDPDLPSVASVRASCRLMGDAMGRRGADQYREHWPRLAIGSRHELALAQAAGMSAMARRLRYPAARRAQRHLIRPSSEPGSNR